MVWVSVIAGTLIAVMFIYNWLNKDDTETVPKESVADQKTSLSLGNGHAVEGLSPQSNGQPASKSTSPSIVLDTQSEPSSDQNKQNGDTCPQSTPRQPVKAMGPPAPPSVTPAPESMAPPPRPKSPPRLKPPTFGYAPAPPRPGGQALRPPPSAASSLRVPQTKVLPNTSMAPSALMPPPKKVSKQVVLEPGHSPLDWAALTSNPNSGLRGKDAPEGLIKVTPSQLKIQNGRKGKDAWTVFQGKVYNITPYVSFHPGGKGEILRGAGKDSAKLFMEVHPWVNWDGMLGECCVGILVGEDDVGNTNNRLDEMD